MLQKFRNMKIAIVGAGNMGGAIAKGLCRGTLVKAKDIFVSDVSVDSLNNIRSGGDDIRISSSNTEIVNGADVVILAVKPWLIDFVAREIADQLDFKKQIIVSIAAGIDLDTLANRFGNSAALFRVIPNTAIEIRESVSTVASRNASDEQEELIRTLFEELGMVFMVPESQLNAFMSLSSCGIAYAFRYIRAAMEGAVEMGIYPGVAKEVVMQTLKGAVSLLEHNNSHPEVEIDKVTTPGGITIKGLNEMEANGFTNAVIKGLKASHLK